ncbi:hypothetical protein DL96DRAFT_1676197 [Flagelloscypha sp. PMI_526]|nr:hypothetical protein DL96DRAFT_1676197 [Flagelloscypha sp. PMI_526]
MSLNVLSSVASPSVAGLPPSDALPSRISYHSQLAISPSNQLDFSINDFESYLTQGSLFVDTTHTLMELITGSFCHIALFRPKGFGKTTTLAMFKWFYESLPEARHKLRIKMITERAPAVPRHPAWRNACGTFHVIKLDFSTMTISKGLTQFREDLAFQIRSAFDDHSSLFGTSNLDTFDAAYVDHYRGPGPLSDTYIINSLEILAQLLYRYGGEKKCLVLIDDIDAPFIKALETPDIVQELKDAQTLVEMFLTASVKRNTKVDCAIIGGVFPISFMDIRGGANSFVCQFLYSEQSQWSTVCGLTHSDVTNLVNNRSSYTETSCPVTVKDLEYRYKGYTVSPAELSGTNCPIYNPYAVLRALSGSGPYINHLTGTGGTRLITSLLAALDTDSLDKFLEQVWILLGNNEITIKQAEECINIENVYLAQKDTLLEYIWQLLLHAGYLTAAVPVLGGNTTRRVRIPNYETRLIWETMLKDIIQRDIIGQIENIGSQFAPKIVNAMRTGSSSDLKSFLDIALSKNTYLSLPQTWRTEAIHGTYLHALLYWGYDHLRGHDNSDEYHWKWSIEVSASNGRADLIGSNVITREGIIIVLNLGGKALEATVQILNRNYLAYFNPRTYTKVHLWGISFEEQQATVHYGHYALPQDDWSFCVPADFLGLASPFTSPIDSD